MGLLNPNHWPVNDWLVINMFYEKLLITDGSFRPVPWLAESWTNNPEFITQDEESSGIIDASHILGRG